MNDRPILTDALEELERTITTVAEIPRAGETVATATLVIVASGLLDGAKRLLEAARLQ